MKDAYDACMDEETIKKEGLGPLLEVIYQVREKFPVKAGQEDSSLSKAKISETVLFLANLGIPALASFGVGADDKDPDTVVVQVSAPWSIGLPAKDYYKDEKVVKKYEDTLAQVIEKVHPEAADVAKDYAHWVVEFEKKLAAASPSAEDSEDVTVSLPLYPARCYKLTNCRNSTTPCP